MKLKPDLIALMAKKNIETKINWGKVRDVKNILEEFYKREMILQQDDANAINLSQCWESLESLIKGTTVEDKKANEFATFTKSLSTYQFLFIETGLTFFSMLETHSRKIKGSGVHYLSLIMWPCASFSKDILGKASGELENLINQQYSLFVSRRTTFGLLSDFDDGNKIEFVAECRSELMKHLSPTSPSVLAAKAIFKRENTYDVKTYWASVAFELPCLHLVQGVSCLLIQRSRL